MKTSGFRHLIALSFVSVGVLAMTFYAFEIGYDSLKNELNQNFAKVTQLASSSEGFNNVSFSFLPETEKDEANKSDLNQLIPLDNVSNKIPDAGDFILADLATEKIILYRDGEPVTTATIRSSGKPGSFWETPTGLYEIEYMNRNHVSSIGNVNMPFSMQYSGNFFVHGWPTELGDNTPVSPGFSGGCIRLDTEGAQQIFDQVERDTDILVIDSSTLRNNKGVPTEADFDLLTEITADLNSFATLYSQTGEVLKSNQLRWSDKVEFGNLTNWLVAMTANEHISYLRNIPTYTYNPTTESYSPTGATVTIEELYPNLLKTDDNGESLHAILKYRGSDNFLAELNKKVRAIGIENAEITLNNHELTMISNTADLYHLGRYLQFQKEFLLDIYSETDAESIVLESGNQVGYKIILNPGNNLITIGR